MEFKANTPDFMPLYIEAQKGAGRREEVRKALDFYKEHAGRPEFADVDLGPAYAKAFLAHCQAALSPTEAGNVYGIVGEFHGFLARLGVLQFANPFDPSGRK